MSWQRSAMRRARRRRGCGSAWRGRRHPAPPQDPHSLPPSTPPKPAPKETRPRGSAGSGDTSSLEVPPPCACPRTDPHWSPKGTRSPGGPHTSASPWPKQAGEHLPLGRRERNVTGRRDGTRSCRSLTPPQMGFWLFGAPPPHTQLFFFLFHRKERWGEHGQSSRCSSSHLGGEPECYPKIISQTRGTVQQNPETGLKKKCAAEVFEETKSLLRPPHPQPLLPRSTNPLPRLNGWRGGRVLARGGKLPQIFTCASQEVQKQISRNPLR